MSQIETIMIETIIFGHVITACQDIAQGYIAIDTLGKVAAVGERNTLSSAKQAAVKQVVDYSGSYIFPGAIDAQVHSRSQKGQEDFIWSTCSAAAGGVTTIVDMPYDANSLICNAERFVQKQQEAQAQARVDFALYATLHPEQGIIHIAELVKAGAIGFKFSTFGTDPVRFPRITPLMMHASMQEIAKYGLVVGVHNEDDETVKALIEIFKAKGETNYLAHSASRPIYAENLAIHQIYELGAETGCRAHVVHCSNARGYEICKSYQTQGYLTTIEACLHYFILSEDQDLVKIGGKGKVNPPIRDSKEQTKLWQHLAAGNITVVSTDHVSWSEDKKTHANIFDNASGATGLSLLVTLLFTGAAKRNIPFTRLAQVLAYNPARLFSIQHRKGALELGKDADLVIIKKSPYIYDSSQLTYNWNKWSPYDGKEIDYKVTATMVRGKWVFQDEVVLAQPGFGEFIHP